MERPRRSKPGLRRCHVRDPSLDLKSCPSEVPRKSRLESAGDATNARTSPPHGPVTSHCRTSVGVEDEMWFASSARTKAMNEHTNNSVRMGSKRRFFMKCRYSLKKLRQPQVIGS